jgi:predicted flap endonuclease-1-like 5' DNA nuclease
VIVLSLVLVIAAAVLLVLGVFQDGLLLIYLSIAACLLAMALLGAGVLLRRREMRAPAGAGDTGPAATTSPPATSTRPGTASRPGAASRPGTAAQPPPPASELVDPEPSGTETGVTGSAMPSTPEPPPAEEAVDEAVVEKATAKEAEVREQVSTPVSAPTRSHAGRRGTGLSSVKGLGPARREALLERFGSEQGMRDASIDELTEVRGVGPTLARAIKDALG